jgi:glycosyl transferase family 8
MSNRVFIGYDSREDIAYRVLRYSLEKHASAPLDIRPLILRELDFPRKFDPLASTEFTYSRFLIPHLCDFKGRALFMDCDMVCVADIMEIFNLDLTEYWLRVVKHDHRPTTTIKMDGKAQTQYPRKNWSSFMLLNCEQLTCWTREAVLTQSGAWLHRFEPIPDEKIGDISFDWNVLDHYEPGSKLVHYTEGGPWFDNYKDHPFGDLWLRYEREFLATTEGQLYTAPR